MGEYTDGRGRVWVVGGRVGVHGVARTGVGVKMNADGEWALPDGAYSMAPVVRA